MGERAEQGGDPSDTTVAIAVAMSAAWQSWAGEVVLAEALATAGSP